MGINCPKSHIKGVKTCTKNVKIVNKKCITYLVLVYISQDFAQTQLNVAPSHDGETVTFRHSGLSLFFLLLKLYDILSEVKCSQTKDQGLSSQQREVGWLVAVTQSLTAPERDTA